MISCKRGNSTSTTGGLNTATDNDIEEEKAKSQFFKDTKEYLDTFKQEFSPP